jgi:hypothetical protein
LQSDQTNGYGDINCQENSGAAVGGEAAGGRVQYISKVLIIVSLVS